MFLDTVQRRNPELLKVALELHKSGEILPDTYVLDLDTIIYNARLLRKRADEVGIELFYMTKQFGRNPLIAKKIRENAIEQAVVVDYKEALVMINNHLPLGNVGHLVQIPKNLIEEILVQHPSFITVYSIDMIESLNSVASQLGMVQKVLLKIIDKDDEVYEGQYGGFYLEDLEKLVNEYHQFSNIEIAGLTSFPCFLFDGEDKLEPTHNVETLQKAREYLFSKGIKCKEINIPSATCVETIPYIKKLGGTQGEPGHALTGTTPLHAKRDLAEIPAMVYVSEISHNLDGKSYFYGGGYYRRGHFEHIIVVDKEKVVKDTVSKFSPESIDYYLSASSPHTVGSTVLASFRTQIFVTRSDVAVVSGIGKGQAKLEGIYDSQGTLIRR